MVVEVSMHTHVYPKLYNYKSALHVRIEINIMISGAIMFYGHIQVYAMRDWVKRNIFNIHILWQDQVMSPATLWLLVTNLAGTALGQSKFIQRCA